MRFYRRWAGNPQGTPEHPKHCIASVADTLRPLSHQCLRRRKFGDLCRQHHTLQLAGHPVWMPEDGDGKL